VVTLGSLKGRSTRGLGLLPAVILTWAALAGSYLAAPPAVQATSADHLGIFPYGLVAPVAGTPWEFVVVAYTSEDYREFCFDDTVHFAYTDGLTSVPADHQFNRGNPGCGDGGDGGLHHFWITPHVGGAQTITVSDVAHPGLQTSMTIEVAPGPASSLSITNLPANSTLGADSHFLVTAKDAYGNDATGYVGTVGFTSTDPLAVFEYTFYGFNGGDAGSKSFVVTFHSAGSRSVTVTDVVHPSITGSASTTVGTAAYFHVELAITADAGNPPDCSVTAMKLDGTPDTSYAGTIHLTSSDPNADLPTDYTFNPTDHGTLLCTSYVTFRTAGVRTLTATQVGNSAVNGTDTTLVYGGDAAEISLVGLSGTTIAGPVNVTVILSDTYGNRAGSGWVYFSSTDPNAILPAAFHYVRADYGNHQFTVTLETPGPVTLTVSGCYYPNECSDSAGTIVYHGPTTHLIVSGLSSPRTTGVAGTVTVRTADAYGNTDTAYAGTVHFTSSDGAAVLPANYTFMPSEHGVHVFSSAVTLNTVGTQSVTATDTVIASITGSQSGVVVTPAAATHFAVSGLTSPRTAGAAGSLTVTALDQYGNTATGYAGTVHFTSSDGAAILPANSTLISGTGTFGVTLKTAGTQSVTATDTVIGSIYGSQSGIVVTPSIVRYGSNDIFATAADVSAHTFPSPCHCTAYIAYAYNFPDALAGAAAAGTVPGPVLFVATSGAINSYTAAELTRLAPDHIVALGSTVVISASVFTALSTYAPEGQTFRYFGTSRFDTAAAVSQNTFPADCHCTAYVAYAMNFPDALAAAAAAGTVPGPVLLVATTGAINTATKNELLRLKPDHIVALGSTVVISASVFNALKAYAPSGQTFRYYGTSRFGTAASISSHTFAADCHCVVYISGANDFNGALAASSAAGTIKGPLLLVSTTGTIDSNTTNELLRLKPIKIIVIGGTNQVSGPVFTALTAYAP
jgi:putative cell wall-binding protein